MLDNFAIKLITLYQHSLSYLIGNQCRFYPSCSHYTQEAILKHGFVKGVRLGAGRILRCHPWHPGGIDLVPDAETQNNPSKSSIL